MVIKTKSLKYKDQTRTHIISKEETRYKVAFNRLYGFQSDPAEIYKKGQKIAARVFSQFGEESPNVMEV